MRLKMENNCTSPSLDNVESHARHAAEAIRLLGIGEINSALQHLNVCLDEKFRPSTRVQKETEHGDSNCSTPRPEVGDKESPTPNTQEREDFNEISPADEVGLLEKRCLINMKLQNYDDVLNDAKRILDSRTDHSLAYKCLLVALCKTNRFDQVKEILKLWRTQSPNPDSIECRTKLEALILAVKSGIDAADAFSNVEDQLGLSYDWLLGRKCQDPRWRFRPLPPGTVTFTLCLKFRFGHCSMGAKCVDAHGGDELDEWKERYTLKSVSKLLDSIKLDGKESYINKLLDRLKEADNPSSILSEKFPDGILIKCSNSENITVLGTNTEMPSWDFKIRTKKPLKYFCLLYEIYREYFFIDSAFSQGHDKTKVNLIDNSKQIDNEVQVVEITTPPPVLVFTNKKSWLMYKISVKFKPEVFGNFRQTIVFDIGEDIRFVRHLTVNVVPKKDEENGDISEIPHISNDNSSRYRMGGAWNFGNADLLDGSTGEKVDLSKLGFILANGTKQSAEFPSALVEPLTKENYKERMMFFLTQEEKARQQILAKYNLTTLLSLTENYVMTAGFNEGLTRYAIDGSFFAKMTLFRDVSEDTAVGRLILRSCNYILLTKTEMVRKCKDKEKIKVYLCPIADKTKNKIYVEIGPACVKDLELKDKDDKSFDIQFQLDRTSFMEMKTVIEKLEEFHLDMLFPDFSINHHIPWSPIKQWGDEPESNVRLNSRQKEALIAITCNQEEGDYKIPPILVIGPFGTGKTFTLAQCIRKLLDQENTRIMICTHSNSAADLYIKEYLDKEVQEGFLEAKPLRIYYHLRNLNSVHPDVLQYCLVENLKFRTPTLEEIMSHRVIVVTLSTSYILMHMDLPQDTFSHILLDEAAQAMESEAITPLMCAGKNTKLVLAGDHMQLSPELFSDEAKSLHPSLLERLHNYYPETHPCKLMLCENYRSHSSVIDFVSDAFYSKKLKCSKVQPVHDTYYPLTFFCARGEEVQETDSTSYYNMAEVFEVVDKVSLLVSSWPESWGDYRHESAIGVLTPYSDQVSRIRMALRKKGLYSVSVERVLNVQGKQFRAVFLSTVRSLRPWVKILPEAVGSEVDLGFFSNPKLLNTALTRTQSLVAVVGDPVSLCSEGKCRGLWNDFVSTCHKNKSLYGINYLKLEERITGHNLRMIWGLNPLADEFEPRRQPTDYLNKISQTSLKPSSPLSDVSDAPISVENVESALKPLFKPPHLMVACPQRLQLRTGVAWMPRQQHPEQFIQRPSPPLHGPPQPYPPFTPVFQRPMQVYDNRGYSAPHPLTMINYGTNRMMLPPPQQYGYVHNSGIGPGYNVRSPLPVNIDPRLPGPNPGPNLGPGIIRQNFPIFPSSQPHPQMPQNFIRVQIQPNNAPHVNRQPFPRQPVPPTYYNQMPQPQLHVNQQEQYATGPPLYQTPLTLTSSHIQSSNLIQPTPSPPPPQHQIRVSLPLTQNSVSTAPQARAMDDGITPFDSNIAHLSVGDLVKFHQMLKKFSMTDPSAENQILLQKIEEAIALARNNDNSSSSMQEPITSIASLPLGRSIWNTETVEIPPSSNPPPNNPKRGSSISQQVNDSQIHNTVEDIWTNLGFSSEVATLQNQINNPPMLNPRPNPTHHFDFQAAISPSRQEIQNGHSREMSNAPWNIPNIPNMDPVVPMFGNLTAQLSSNREESYSRPQDTFETGRSYANVAKRAVSTAAVGSSSTVTTSNIDYISGSRIPPLMGQSAPPYPYPPRFRQQRRVVLPTSVIKEPSRKRNPRP